MSYTKVPKYKIDPWTKLTRKEAAEYEKNILIRLNKNFECICKKKKDNHFPIYRKDMMTGRGDLGLVLSNCGNNLRQSPNQNIDDIEEQIDCIVYNMKKSNIIQLDVGYKGNNLCVKNGTLSMIDFGQGVMDNIGYNDFFKNALKNEIFGEYYYTILKEQLLWIVNNADRVPQLNMRGLVRKLNKRWYSIIKCLKNE